MSVTVVSCVYGSFGRFLPAWLDQIARLDPAPDEVIVSTDMLIDAPGVRILRRPCFWEHPQACHLDRAILWADTEWVWIVDIDDLAHPDALQGIDQVDADVWLMGFDRSDGVTYIPPVMTNDEYLASERNVYPAGSAISTAAFLDAGGFADIALQDWGLWRSLAAHGASFQVSGRTHYQYMRHPDTRGETELTLDARQRHLLEMNFACS